MNLKNINEPIKVDFKGLNGITVNQKQQMVHPLLIASSYTADLSLFHSLSHCG